MFVQVLAQRVSALVVRLVCLGVTQVHSTLAETFFAELFPGDQHAHILIREFRFDPRVQVSTGLNIRVSFEFSPLVACAFSVD